MTLPIRNSRIQLPQGQIFWREVGRGKPLVFLHGAWQTSEQWSAVMQGLGSSYQCLAPDLLGFGESDRPRLAYSIDVEVECLFDFLEALQLRQICLVGHSLGSWIAASYALKYPEQVERVVLLAPEGVPSRVEHRWLWDRWLVSPLPLLYWLLCVLRPWARLFQYHHGIDALLARRRELRRSPIACRLLFRRRTGEIVAEYLQSRLDRLKCPVLLVQGGRDGRDISSMAAVYASSLPNVSVQHMLQSRGVELPEVAAEALVREIRLFVPA
jgi:pimeloyl-ACP methyl ester carboxylesterase